MANMDSGGLVVRAEGLNRLINYYRKIGKPLFTHGKTGIGKTAIIKKNSQDTAVARGRVFTEWIKLTKEDRLALLNNEECSKRHLYIDIRTALLEPTDLLGLPNSSGEFVSWKPTLLFRVLSNPDVSADVFFDEFNLGSRMVQNASYQIILDKSIGELCFGNNVWICSAGNSASDRANIIESPAPLNDRFGHATLDVPLIDEWVDFNMNSKNPNPKICAFLKFKPEFIHNFSPKNKEHAFSTPRSLQFLAELIEGLDEVKESDMDDMNMLAESKCGSVFAGCFEAFLKTTRKINIDEILDNPQSVKQFGNNELDKKYAVISGVAYKCKENFKKNIDKAFEVAYHIPEPEFGIFMIRMIRELVGVAKFNEHARKSDIWLNKLSKHFKGMLGWD